MHNMHRVILLMFGLFGLHHANNFSQNDTGQFSNSSISEKISKLEVRPELQYAREYEDVVIDCIARDYGDVSWERANALSLPKGASVEHNRLRIYSIKYDDGGQYVCYNQDKTQEARAEVQVYRTTTIGYSVSGLKWSTSSFVTSGLPTSRSPAFYYTTDTPYPCTYGICNGTCCTENLASTYFDCSNGQKINRSLVCNRENDCTDGSDESRCAPWPPKITVLPKRKVQIFCGDQEKEKSGTLTLECQSVGHPTPVIMWKKYDGHVPSKCQQYSKHGHGILTCPDFQQSDQGAYSCLAKNSVKLAESQPKSIAKCVNTINCRGFRVVNEEGIEHCLECYCSGKASRCQSIKSSPTINKFPFPSTKTEIFVKETGEIVFLPTISDWVPAAKDRKSAQEIIYCTMTESDFEGISFLKSFGRNIIIPRHTGKADFSIKAPELIIRGNGLTLMYRVNLISLPKENTGFISARFWPGNWHHVDKRAASRADLMRVLSNVDTLFVRCEYQQGSPVILENKTISLESSVITDSGTSVSYIEKCQCPTGYDGLSCESCAAGYKKKPQGDDFICDKVYVPTPCSEGYTGPKCDMCNSSKGYIKKGNLCVKPECHPHGSRSIHSSSPPKCDCKVGVTGEYCDECTDGYFYLGITGCLKCWCSGITNQCKSSNLQRSFISNIPRGGYNSSDGRNFWLLPPDFNGNRLTSYGGYLNYTIKYKSNIPKQNALLTVEFLSADDITLTYTHKEIDKSTIGNDKSWSIPVFETDWKKSDKSSVSRGEFLMVLSKIKAIYIESPYHLSSGLANLTSTLMSSAFPVDGDDTKLALEVEECDCPKGYTGLSCENCSDGYYKKRNGTVIQCIKCNCSNCDPEFGCPDCPGLTYRDNPENEKMPVCKPCPCNGNGISCLKDDLNQIFCRCKPGYTGMHCENTIPRETDEFTITISPRRIRGKKVGTAILLNCSFWSHEEMILKAQKTYGGERKNPLTISSNHSETITNQERRKTTIFEVVLENELEAIECIVYDARGKLAGYVLAVVEDPITILRPVKIINCYSDRIDVKESESKDIICEATGSPSPMVNWYRLVNGSSEKVDTSEGVHSIESASLKDNGTVYTCIAENSEGDKAMCTQVLIVRQRCEVINIIPKAVKVEEKKNITIECKTSANSSVTWSLLDSESEKPRTISSPRAKVKGGHLQIFNSEVSDSGIYICSANGENGIINKTISVVVEMKKVPPVATIQAYDKTLKVGENFEVSCVGTGEPTPRIVWRKFSASMDSNIVVSNNKLKILGAVPNNTGVYECEAWSTSGRDTSYISVEVEEVKYPPRVNISQEVITVHDGEDATLVCLAIGNPRPKLTWFAPNITFLSHSSANDSMILIDPQKSIKEEITFKVTKQMDGLTITCVADSTAGKAEKMTAIRVLHSKGGVNETVKFVPIGSYIELICEIPGNLTWKKSGGLTGNECPIPFALMIPSVQIQNNGTYICKVPSGSEKIINLIVVGFVPKFSSTGSSYLIVPMKLKSDHELRVEVSFNAASENGLILNKDNDKVAIYLEKGKIHLRIFSNDGDFLDIHTHSSIKLNEWYSLVVGLKRNRADIVVYESNSEVQERKFEDSGDFNISLITHESDSFFVGGVTNYRRHKGSFPRHSSYFDGCISRLKINNHEYDIVKEGAYSKNVTLCRRCSEDANLCHERGKCMDAPTQYGFICVCPYEQNFKDKSCPQASCSGKGCETQLDLCSLLKPCNDIVLHKCHKKINNLQCNCAFGYTGTVCEKVQEYSFCVRGNGFVRLPSNLLERRLGEPEIIRMAFTLHQLDGQLLWQGDAHNHLSIAVVGGRLRYIYLNQHSKLLVHSSNKLEINKKHTLFIWRLNETARVELEGSGTGPEVYRNSTGKYNTNRVAGDIYLGNAPKPVFLTGHHVGLNGCIHYVSFGDNANINLREKEFEKFSVFKPPKS